MRKRGVIAYFLLLAIAAVVAAVLVARFITTDSQTKTISPEPLKTRDADSSASEMPPIVKIEPPILESEIIAPPVTTTKPQSIDAPPASIPESELPAKKPPDPRITSSNSVTTSQIDIEAIVLVRCRFENQYFKTSNQPWGEERFSLGSGIIISEAGYILSVKHLFEFEKEKIGFLIDGIKEILSLSPEEITSPPSIFKGFRTEYLTGLGKKDDRIIILLNIDNLLTSEEKIKLKESLGILEEKGAGVNKTA